MATKDYEVSFWKDLPELLLERLKFLGRDPKGFAQDTYGRMKQGAAQATPMPVQPLDPNLRQGVDAEALPADVDPSSEEFLRRQAIARAMLGQQPAP